MSKGTNQQDLGSAEGMRTSLRNTKKQEGNELETLMEELAEGKQGIPTSTVAGTYLSFEGLVRHMHENPLNPLQAPGRRDVSYFAGRGFLPLATEQTESSERMVIGINAYDLQDTTKLQSANTIQVKFQDEIESHLELTRENTTFLLLNSTDFDNLKQYVNNAEERGHFLGAIDPESEADETCFAIMRNAVRKGATDIHIEPVEDRVRIRYRVDGVLQEGIDRIPIENLVRIVARTKILAGMDIVEKRRSQDGSIRFKPEHLEHHPELEEYTLRVSTMQTSTGDEKVALRLLRRGKLEFSLGSLGYEEGIVDEIRRLCSSPQGLFLVTGPTGSGKTTSLYSVLQYRNSPEVNIMTIEDPVEIDINGINQSQVHRAIDWDFDKAVRAYLRQDPDIFLIGEIRDRETADAAMKAANTGHLVLSTLHTNDSVSTLLRLYELGVPNSIIQSSLLGVAAQRLVRLSCQDCTVEYDAKQELNGLLGAPLVEGEFILKLGEGCAECNGGYQGRTVISELWTIDDEARQMIYEGNKSHSAYMEVAQRKGMRPLLHSGLDLVLNGKTTLHELKSRAISPDQFIRHREEITERIKNYQREI